MKKIDALQDLRGIVILMVVLFFVTGKGSEYYTDIVNIVCNFLLIHNPSESIHPYSWTLVFEMFCYLTFASIIILFGLLIWGGQMQGVDFNIFLSNYNYYFFAGIFIFLLHNKIKIGFPTYVLLASFFLFLILPFYTDNILILLSSAIFFFVVYLENGRSNKILNIVGNASFSIYLVHALVISIGKYIILDIEIIKFIILFIASLLLGYLYYKYFEKIVIKKASKGVAK